MSQPVQVEIPPIEEINYLIPHSSFCTTTCGKEVTVFLAPFLRKHLETTVAESKLATENTSTHPPTQLDDGTHPPTQLDDESHSPKSTLHPTDHSPQLVGMNTPVKQLQLLVDEAPLDCPANPVLTGPQLMDVFDSEPSPSTQLDNGHPPSTSTLKSTSRHDKPSDLPNNPTMETKSVKPPYFKEFPSQGETSSDLIQHLIKIALTRPISS